MTDTPDKCPDCGAKLVRCAIRAGVNGVAPMFFEDSRELHDPLSCLRRQCDEWKAQYLEVHQHAEEFMQERDAIQDQLSTANETIKRLAESLRVSEIALTSALGLARLKRDTHQSQFGFALETVRTALALVPKEKP